MAARVADVTLEDEFVPAPWRNHIAAAREGFDLVWMVDPDVDPATGRAPGVVGLTLVNTIDSVYADCAVVKVDPDDWRTWTVASPGGVWLPCDEDDD